MNNNNCTPYIRRSFADYIIINVFFCQSSERTSIGIEKCGAQQTATTITPRRVAVGVAVAIVAVAAVAVVCVAATGALIEYNHRGASVRTTNTGATDWVSSTAKRRTYMIDW